MEQEHPRPPHGPPHVKQNKLLIGVIILLVLIILLLLFKPLIPPPPSPPGQSPGPIKLPGPEKLKTDKGTVISFKYNAHRDINALQLKTSDAGILTLDFRPHTAQTVMGIAATGQTINVQYTIHPDDEKVGYQLMQLKNEQTGVSKVLNELPPPPDPPYHSAENFKLQNPTLITDQYGGIVALKKDNALFHFKPGLVDDISALIKSSHLFSLMAVRRDENLGFVNIDHDKVYIVISITIDNKTFLVR